MALLFLFLYWLICEIALNEGRNSTSCEAIPWLHPCETNGYDKTVSPGHDDGSITPVKIHIYVESLGNFQATKMEFDIDIYFVEWWHDNRLKHNHRTFLSFYDRNQIERFWVPDLYFANSKSAQYNYVTVPNMVLKLYPSGEVRYSVRINLKISCHMNLQGYPMDLQKCFLKIVSYGYITTQMNVSWINGSDAIEMNPDIKPTDLKVYKIENTYCDGRYFNMEFTCLLANFYLKRDLGFSMLQLFIPTTFLVVISWISFWIDPHSVPGRVGLAVTTLLTLSTQVVGLHYHLPPVSYLKAQDVWLAACLLFLFAALIEFAMVNMFARRSDRLAVKLIGTQKQVEVQISIQSLLLICCTRKDGKTPHNVVLQKPTEKVDVESIYASYLTYRQRVHLIDKLSRWLFPAAFVLFCICYWCIYFKSLWQIE